MMDARDICRRLNCSPLTLSDWLDRGCPVDRNPPDARFDIACVRQWLTEQGITDWPRESDRELDVPIRVLLHAVQRQTITPWQAEKVMTNLGAGIWE